MGKKLTIEFVRMEFEKEGSELLSKKYINSRTKLEYICPKGHRHSISWDNWRDGHRCSYCVNLGKPSIGFIKSEFEEKGYELLTTEYINAHQKLEYVCPNGHRHNISWNSWKSNNQRCSYCYGNTKLTIEFIRSEFEKEGYILLTNRYVNNRQKLIYRCQVGHEHSISWDNWCKGQRCSICYDTIHRFGETSPNWKGGIACEPYCDAWADKKYKNDIKARDRYGCQNPDCWGTMSEDLTIHHIDYNKKNCGPENLITLCRSCNSRANKDREWHTTYYTEIMRRRNLLNEIQSCA